MQLGPNKLKFLLNLGIAPSLKELLKNQEVIGTDRLVVSFDDLLNDGKEKIGMDICIRYWNRETDSPRGRPTLALSGLGHAVSEICWTLLKRVLKTLT